MSNVTGLEQSSAMTLGQSVTPVAGRPPLTVDSRGRTQQQYEIVIDSATLGLLL